MAIRHNLRKISGGERSMCHLGLEKCTEIKQNLVKVRDAMQNAGRLNIVEKI